MKKASIIMAGLACAMIAAAYTNSVPISTNTRAATEKWTAIRFEPALPPTPANAASKFLDGNREWQTVTAAQIGALTNETDEAALAALAAYAAYWPRNATASSWFTYTTNSGAITITGYGGGTDVVIPDYINGWPVTEIGANAFARSDVTSIGGAGNVVTVGDYAFSSCTLLTSVLLTQVQTVGAFAFIDCYSLASVSMPQAQAIGGYAFFDCGSLTSVYFDNDVPTIGTDIFAEIAPNQVTNYVTNPQATGWGATFGGMPVMRPTLYADAIYQAGVCLVPMSDFTATNALFNTWFAGLFSETNKWMAAYGWGNWAGPVASNAAAIAVLQTNTLTRQEVDALQSAVDAKADKSTTLTINGIAGNLSSNNVWGSALPTNGCTDIYGVTPEITGKTYAYYLYATNNYTLSIAADAPRCHYSLEIIGTNVCTLSAGMQLRGEWKATGTNAVVIVPSTGTLWNVYGRGM